VGRIGSTMVQTFNTLSIMQIRMTTATANLRNAESELFRIQQQRVVVVEGLGQGSAYAQALIAREAELVRRVADEHKDLAIAQQQNIIGYVGLGLNAIKVIPALFDLNKHLTQISWMSTQNWVWGGFTALNTLLTSNTIAAYALQAAIIAALAAGAKVATTTLLGTDPVQNAIENIVGGEDLLNLDIVNNLTNNLGNVIDAIDAANKGAEGYDANSALAQQNAAASQIIGGMNLSAQDIAESRKAGVNINQSFYGTIAADQLRRQMAQAAKSAGTELDEVEAGKYR